MSIKKTSILALSVLLSYESFAAPTVLATTPRLGASSSVASTGRGKATTSVSIGGGLNKLTSNRGQSSFTPNSAPTDKQNELIESFQKEIQNVRDAVAEELQAQNDKIRELESVIEEKDEKIAELEESIEESIDEKIESKGFITAENVTSDILTAKQEAVRQATKAAVAEVNSMGFAKTATVQSDILTAKNAAIAQAKTEAVAEVNGMGFAKTATIESDILNAKNAAIEQATTAALAEVESKGFATNASVQNLKAEITTERNAALKSYATSAQLAEGIDAAKATIKADRDDALKSYATSAQLAEDIDAAKSEITNARNAALKSYATSADVSSAVTAAKSEITTERNAALKSYATSADVSSAVTAAKTDAITTANNAITTAIAAESAARSAIVEKLATKEELQNLEVGVDEERLAGIIDGKLQEQGFATATDLNELDDRVAQNTQNIADALSDITEEKGRIENLNDRLDKDFVTSTALTTYKGEVADAIASLATKDEVSAGNLEELLSGRFVKPTALQGFATTESVNNRFNEISDTIAGNLLADTSFKEGVLAGLSTDLKELPSRVDNLEKPATLEGLLSGKFVKPETLTGYATKGELGDYAKAVDVEGLTTDLADLKQPAKLAGLLGDIYVKPATLDNRITGLSATYATKEALNTVDGKFANYLKGTDFDSRLSSSTVLDGKFVKPADFGGLLKDADLSTNGKFSALSTTVSSLGNTYATKDELGNYATATDLANLKKPATLAGLLGDIYVKPATLDNRITGLSATYATKEALNTIDGKFANYVKGADFGGLLKDADLSTNSKFSALSTTVSGLGNTYATKSELGNYATATDLANLKKPATLTTLLGDTYVKPATLDNRITGLSATYATKGDVNTLQNSVNSMPSIIVESISTPGDKMYIGNWTNKKDGKLLVVTSDNVSYHVDDKEQPIFMTQDTLGTSIDILLDNKEGKTRLHEIASGVDSLNTNVGKINSNVTSLGTSVGNLSSSFTTLSNKAVTTDNFADKLTANNVVTTSNMTTKGVVTKGTLSADLYSELTSSKTSNGVCQTPTGAKGNLINLLNSGDITGCGN